MIVASKWTPQQFEAWVESVGGVAFAAKNLGVTERTVVNYCYGDAIPLSVEHAANWITSQGWRSKMIDYMPPHQGKPGRAKGVGRSVHSRPIYPKL